MQAHEGCRRDMKVRTMTANEASKISYDELYSQLIHVYYYSSKIISALNTIIIIIY